MSPIGTYYLSRFLLPFAHFAGCSSRCAPTARFLPACSCPQRGAHHVTRAFSTSARLRSFLSPLLLLRPSLTDSLSCRFFSTPVSSINGLQGTFKLCLYPSPTRLFTPTAARALCWRSLPKCLCVAATRLLCAVPELPPFATSLLSPTSAEPSSYGPRVTLAHQFLADA